MPNLANVLLILARIYLTGFAPDRFGWTKLETPGFCISYHEPPFIQVIRFLFAKPTLILPISNTTNCALSRISPSTPNPMKSELCNPP